MNVWSYYPCVLLLLVGNGLSWCSNLFMLPGNWLILGWTALFAWLLPEEDGRGIGWSVVAVVAGLAVLGEVVELAAGALGAAKQRASVRSQILAIVGAVVGTVLGGLIGIPVPIVGPIVAAVGGGAVGAFAGAFLGERWQRRRVGESLAVGKAAFLGRLVGTAGKLAIGGIMLVVVAVDAFL